MSESGVTANLRPGQLIGNDKYRLIRPIGAGGMGSVWEAQQEGMAGFAKRVALKLMLVGAQVEEEARRLFLNEARISARLSHPNLIEIYDLGQDQNLDYIAMEFIQGKDLSGLIKASKTGDGPAGLPWEVATHIMIEVCKGLHYAHELKDDNGDLIGLIHRDLKPGNVLVSRDGYIKVIDFGIAKSALNDGKTRTGVIKGTPAYMPPEQLAAQPLNRRADLFALGAILFELICGYPPFVGETLYNIIFAIQGGEPQNFPNEADKFIPENLKAAILKCLQKDKEDRYFNAKEFRVALEDVMMDHKIRMDHEILAERLVGFQDAHTEAGFLPTADGISSDTPAPRSAVADELLQGKVSQADSLSSMASQPTAMLQSGELELMAQPEAPKDRSTLLYALVAVLILGAVAGITFAFMMGPQEKKTPKLASKTQKRLTKGATGLQPSFYTPDKQSEPIKQATRTPPQPTQRRSAPNPPTQAPTPPKAPAKRKRVRVARAKRRKIKRALRMAPAKLVVDIRPTCQLFEGAKRLGSSNGSPIELTPGPHRFRCINFPSRLNHVFRINARPGQTKRIKKRFRRGTLFVLSFPSAMLFLKANGQRFGLIGQSHEAIKLFQGKYQLELRKKSNPSLRKNLTITISPGQVARPKVIW